MTSKIRLLMEETGCDEGEAELALEMCGYEVEAAVKALPRLLKNIAVIKAKFIHPGASPLDASSQAEPSSSRFGLLLVIGNIKTRTLLRSRAVLSYNPAVYAVPLDRDWFSFERALYGCRLWDGSLPAESLEIEHGVNVHFRGGLDPKLFGSGEEGLKQAAAELGGVLGRLLRSPGVEVKLKPEVLDLGQFQSLDPRPQSHLPPPAKRPGPVPRGSRAPEALILKVKLDEDPEGKADAELRPGDLVSALIVDGRDIAQYIAKLLGCLSERGAMAILAPVESVEDAPGGRLVRVRFAVNVCGEAVLAGAARYRVERNASRDGLRPPEGESWWRKFFA